LGYATNTTSNTAELYSGQELSPESNTANLTTTMIVLGSIVAAGLTFGDQ